MHKPQNVRNKKHLHSTFSIHIRVLWVVFAINPKPAQIKLDWDELLDDQETRLMDLICGNRKRRHRGQFGTKTKGPKVKNL